MKALPDTPGPSSQGTDTSPLEHGIDLEQVYQVPALGYHPLSTDTEEIRLLSISPDSESSVVRCNLVNIPILNAPKYTALSYCWGDAEDTEQILVNNCAASITKNLGVALRELRRQSHLIVWVDALCIDQKDDDEKSHQILRMRDIYSKANTTFAWLGRDKHGYAEHAFAHVDLLAWQLPKERFDSTMSFVSRGSPVLLPPGWEAFKRLLTRRYWKRTWIIQELAMSPLVVLCWGKHSRPLKYFILSMKPLDGLRLFGWPQEYLMVTGIIDILHRTLESGNTMLTLLDTLIYSCLSEATKPIDKIFGILSLAHDGSYLIPQPDYRKPIETVLHELTTSMLLAKPHEGILDLICLNSRPTSSDSNLPSWVVNWPALWDHKYGHLWSSPQKRGLTCGYKACPDSQIKVQFADAGWTLICNGLVFDTISAISSSRTDSSTTIPPQSPQPPEAPKSELLKESNVYGTEQDLYEAIWRTLIMNRERTNPIRDPDTFREEFSRLWSRVEIKRVSRTKDFNANLAAIRDFEIYGRTMQEWAIWYASQSQSMSSAPMASELSKTATASDPSDPKDPMHRFVRSVRLGRMRRRVFTTRKGYVGLVHPGAKVGDEICLLQGATMPVILRKWVASYVVVGEAYVQGIMDGETWGKGEEGLRQWQEFYIR